MSDDGRHALTLIAFIGSVFSPYYAWARRRRGIDGASPEDHVAINVALYGPGARWAMTERSRRALDRGADGLAIGPSSLAWHGDRLDVQIDERCAPLPRRLRGHLRLRPAAFTGTSWTLDTHGRHRWSPIAPVGRIEVELRDPRMRWQGTAYLDHNTGSEPLESAFEDWTWSRASGPQGDALLHYDATRLDGSRLALALRMSADGRLEPVRPGPAQPMPATAWGLARSTRHDPASLQRLEDGPFYARTLLQLPQGRHAVHETLSLQRFRAPWVQALLPFRMPRRG